MGFQEAGYNCVLLHSCGKMSTIEPQTYFFSSKSNVLLTTGVIISVRREVNFERVR